MKTLANSIQTISQQVVLVRCNFDVPITEGKVTDASRIEDATPTIKLLLEHHNEVLLLAHYDRPEGFESDKSLRPVLGELESLLGQPVGFIEYQKDFNQLQFRSQGKVQLLENLRFWSGEEANELGFAEALARLGTYYVNESFATAHREHASIVGIPKHIPAFAGLAFEKEVQTILQVKNNPKKPLVVVIGGAKLETKEPLVRTFAQTADNILVGGKIALDLHNHPQPLPANVSLAQLVASGRDITPESAQEFSEIINHAGTVIWNGAMGVFEETEHQLGTKIVAEAINHSPAFTLVGGGDTEAALTIFNQEDGIDHISMGGGAMLELLTNETLPGIKALD